MWIELSDSPKFSYAEDIVVSNTVFFITGEHLYHIIGLLNSKLITWYFKHCLGTTSGVGTNRWLKYTVEQIPLCPVHSDFEIVVSALSKKYDTSKDRQIDAMVCTFYGLNKEEADYILNT